MKKRIFKSLGLLLMFVFVFSAIPAYANEGRAAAPTTKSSRFTAGGGYSGTHTGVLYDSYVTGSLSMGGATTQALRGRVYGTAIDRASDSVIGYYDSFDVNVTSNGLNISATDYIYWGTPKRADCTAQFLSSSHHMSVYR